MLDQFIRYKRENVESDFFLEFFRIDSKIDQIIQIQRGFYLRISLKQKGKSPVTEQLRRDFRNEVHLLRYRCGPPRSYLQTLATREQTVCNGKKRKSWDEQSILLVPRSNYPIKSRFPPPPILRTNPFVRNYTTQEKLDVAIIARIKFRKFSPRLKKKKKKKSAKNGEIFYRLLYHRRRSIEANKSLKLSLTLPQLMYSTAVSRKKKQTKSPWAMELTKFGAGIRIRASYYDAVTCGLHVGHGW